MAAFAYVGSAVDAAGFRLIGAQCWAPLPGEEPAAVRAALRAAESVFISSEVAQRLPRAELDTALAAGRPLLVIIPTAETEPYTLDPAERARAQLGLER
jgi:vacuolar-type H+-ATPase subunit F/Vma7